MTIATEARVTLTLIQPLTFLMMRHLSLFAQRAWAGFSLGCLGGFRSPWAGSSLQVYHKARLQTWTYSVNRLLGKRGRFCGTRGPSFHRRSVRNSMVADWRPMCVWMACIFVTETLRMGVESVVNNYICSREPSVATATLPNLVIKPPGMATREGTFLVSTRCLLACSASADDERYFLENDLLPLLQVSLTRMTPRYHSSHDTRAVDALTLPPRPLSIGRPRALSL